MRAVELFAGAGGLALGASIAGIEHDAVIEWNRSACETILENRRRGTVGWPLFQCDVRDMDFRTFQGADVVAGGPPCQPFSIGGKHRGNSDVRNMFPEAIRSVREIQPKMVLLENVKGLTRTSFADFFEYVLLQLQFPTLIARKSEDWVAHAARLRRSQALNSFGDLSYRVWYRRLNAADFGVPQRRERVFIVAARSDLNLRWAFPEPTHSQESLLRDQWVTGDYWSRHGIDRLRRRDVPTKFAKRVQRLRSLPLIGDLPAWRTVRDAITDLPDPNSDHARSLGHLLVPGARTYGGHSGSPIDEPAKTLKAGDHGVPGGENMLAMPDGSVRYFTVRESARIQTFPDYYVFPGSWSESMRQLGNAVAVDMASILARRIRRCIETGDAESDILEPRLQVATV
ncbi:MAG: DNA (cytosine-5-)-methyltransferase [Planctomycetota bacterium]|nr:DNA (cytosine-5-)-methyltransferase [Planctomycetota bacterium]